MSKRIAIFCDGTWNTYDDPSPTNVFKLRNQVKSHAEDGMRQLVYYDTGVGTQGGWLRRAYDGATGGGLWANVREAYAAIIESYDEGDELFLFGFSRGAYTVRSLAGLIRNCGILRRDRRDFIDAAYTLYRKRSQTTAPDSERAKRFRRDNAVVDVTRIRFIGVWDTVGSLGNPLIRHRIFNRRYLFHDVKLSSTVDAAYQALAIDEHRKHFRPALWGQQVASENQALEQVWFIGVHSDVGGGYADAGLANIALHWLAARAMYCGLEFDWERLKRQLGSDFPAKLSIPHNSHRGFYTLFRAINRPIDPPQRDATPIRRNERLHWTVVERYQQDLGYRPTNLVDYLRRNPDVLHGDSRNNPRVAGP